MLFVLGINKSWHDIPETPLPIRFIYIWCQVAKYTKYARLFTLQSVADARFSDELHGACGVRFYLAAQIANIDVE